MRIPLLSLALLVASSAALGTASAQGADAKANYEEYCRKCHGVRGTPPKAMKEKFPKIATFNAQFITEHPVDSIVKILNKGKGEDMVSFKEKMTPAEIAAVAQYVHELQKPKP